jgi:hypothetical protein
VSNYCGSEAFLDEEVEMQGSSNTIFSAYLFDFLDDARSLLLRFVL